MRYALRMLAMGAFDGTDANGSMPNKADLLLMDYVLDAEPFVAVAARSDIDTLQLGYVLDGEPFIGVSQ